MSALNNSRLGLGIFIRINESRPYRFRPLAHAFSEGGACARGFF